jgi:hypothetical protein
VWRCSPRIFFDAVLYPACLCDRLITSESIFEPTCVSCDGSEALCNGEGKIEVEGDEVRERAFDLCVEH